MTETATLSHSADLKSMAKQSTPGDRWAPIENKRPRCFQSDVLPPISVASRAAETAADSTSTLTIRNLTAELNVVCSSAREQVVSR